ncbi:hypothetical protein BH11PSE11_BH11PSE11_32830 [soil metagenome]
MSQRFFDCIDWKRPWLAPLIPAAKPVIGAPDWREALNAAACGSGLRNHLGLPIRFVAQSDLPNGLAYEAHIGATGRVPTRDNLHDFFNALTWLTFPSIKSRLNALQAREIERAASSAASSADTGSEGRGKLRDAATIFDENSALLITANSALVDDLRNRRWQSAFLDRRQSFGLDCSVWLFGHAIQEKLTAPYKAITAHSWVVPASADFFSMSVSKQRAWIDSSVGAQLSGGLVTADFTPLPVLGIPGWFEVQDADFYNDAKVFRPLRRFHL